MLNVAEPGTLEGNTLRERNQEADGSAARAENDGTLKVDSGKLKIK